MATYLYVCPRRCETGEIRRGMREPKGIMVCQQCGSEMGRDFHTEAAELPGPTLREYRRGEDPESFRRHLRREARARKRKKAGKVGLNFGGKV